MAVAVLRFGMVFYGVVLVMLVLCNSDTVTGDNPITNATTPVTSKTTTPTTKRNVSSTTSPPTGKGNSTTAPTATPTGSTVRPSTGKGTAGPITNGTKSTPTSKNMTTPTAHGNHTVSSTNKMIPTPTPEGHGTDRGKWVATAFAVFFLITTIVMTVLYCRQRKIYRELEGDSSLSRLI